MVVHGKGILFVLRTCWLSWIHLREECDDETWGGIIQKTWYLVYLCCFGWAPNRKVGSDESWQLGVSKQVYLSNNKSVILCILLPLSHWHDFTKEYISLCWSWSHYLVDLMVWKHPTKVPECDIWCFYRIVWPSHPPWTIIDLVCWHEDPGGIRISALSFLDTMLNDTTCHGYNAEVIKDAAESGLSCHWTVRGGMKLFFSLILPFL